MYYKNRTYLITILAAVLISVIVSFLLRDYFGFLGSDVEFRAFISGFGIWAPLVFVSATILEVVIAPLPGGIGPIVSVVLFGAMLGIFYSWIGNLIGSIIAFFLARLFGERIIRFFSPSFDKDHYGKVVKEHSRFFWYLYAFPFVPVDVLSFALGASDIPFRRFAVSVAVAFLLRVSFLGLLGLAVSNTLFT